MADPANRKPLADMSDREILEEIGETMRVVADVVESFASNPMIDAIANGANPMMALMGR